jgi:hypothetical protein
MSAVSDLQPVRLLSTTQLRAAEGLAGGLSPTKVALRAGVNVKTLFNWRKLPEFQRALEHARAGTPERLKTDGLSDSELVDAWIGDSTLSVKERQDALKIKYAIQLAGQQAPVREPTIVYSLPPGSEPVLVEYRARPE